MARWKSLNDRFWERVEKSDGCWLWRGTVKPNGYGKIYGAGRGWHAHRLAWVLSNGPIPAGLCVCHVCDVRHCVRPEHLFLGTHADNTEDMYAKGRAAPSAFGRPEIHRAAMAARDTARGSRIASAKLSEAQVMEIKALLPLLNNAEVGRRYGVRRATIRRIRHGITWAHVSVAPP